MTHVLAETADRAEAAGVSSQTMALDGPAAAEICRVARGLRPRLVVIGAHGWGRVRRLLHGSVSTDVLIFVGANPCIAHPIMWQRVMMNRRQPEIVGRTNAGRSSSAVRRGAGDR